MQVEHYPHVLHYPINQNEVPRTGQTLNIIASAQIVY